VSTLGFSDVPGSSSEHMKDSTMIEGKLELRRFFFQGKTISYIQNVTMTIGETVFKRFYI
jgi:hypothetical protein